MDCFDRFAPQQLPWMVLHLRRYLTTPEMNPALRRGGLMSFFR